METIEKFLEEASQVPGCTDLTIYEDGTIGQRVHNHMAVAHKPDLFSREWTEVVKYLAGDRTSEALAGDGRSIGLRLGDRRYRVTFARCSLGLEISIRILPLRVPSVTELNLSSTLVDKIASVDWGLVVIGGQPRAGKSTTMAAAIERRKELRGGKFVTIEDPVEYEFASSDSAIFTQREIGPDASSFHTGLMTALRQDPDVVMIQELRDRDAISIALQMALAGKTVYASLHVNEAQNVPQKLISMMGEEYTDLVATVLQAALVQRLLDSPEGVAPIFDVLYTADSEGKRFDSIENKIRTGSWKALRQEMKMGASHGMMTFEQSIELQRQGGFF